MGSPRTMENRSMTMIVVVATTKRENSSVQILRRSMPTPRSNLFRFRIYLWSCLKRSLVVKLAWYKWKRYKTVEEIFLRFLLLSNWDFFTSPIPFISLYIYIYIYTFLYKNIKYLDTRSKWKRIPLSHERYVYLHKSSISFVRIKTLRIQFFPSPLG